MIRSHADEIVKAERTLRGLFATTFIQMPEAIAMLSLSPQYARIKILEMGEADTDYFMLAGRYFVSVDFINRLIEQLKERAN